MRVRGKAKIESEAAVVDEKVKTRSAVRKSIDVDIPDGSASVSVTHGFKDWFTDKFCGKTVESTCTVTIPCKNNPNAINEANKIASQLAYDFSILNGEKVQKDLEAFANEEMPET